MAKPFSAWEQLERESLLLVAAIALQSEQLVKGAAVGLLKALKLSLGFVRGAEVIED